MGYKSLFGKYLGINSDGLVVYDSSGTARGPGQNVTLLGTSTTIPAKSGTYVISSSATHAYTLAAPVTGVDIVILKETAAASSHTVHCASTAHDIGVNTQVLAFSTGGTAFSARLIATSTTRWSVAGVYGTIALTTD